MLLFHLIAVVLVLWGYQNTEKEKGSGWRLLLEEDAIGRQEVDIQEEPYQVEGTVEYLWVEEEQL